MIRESDVTPEPQPSQWLRVEIVHELSAMARMRPEWDALLEASDAGPFNAWEWIYPWCRRIAPERRPLILTARDRTGKLVGLMPLGFELCNVLGRQVGRLSFLGETYVGSDYLDVVARRGMEEPVTRAFAHGLREMHGGWDVLDLLDLHEGSLTEKVLRETFPEMEVRVTDRYVCPYETFTPGEPFDAFLKRTGRRDNYLRRRKWLEKQEGYCIERTEAPGALAAPMADFFRLHSARWAADGGSQGIQSHEVEAFHRDATQFMAERGLLRLYTMKVGGRAVASVYGLIYRDTFIYYQSGYDPEWRNRSVGLVLVGETFKDAIQAGLTQYDFLRGTETYKSDWTTKQRRTVALRIHSTQGAGHWFTRREELARGARNVVKRLLPDTTVEKIRRLRRRQPAG
jgi:CelD/BcsL family acetyltransferase involved in cellulose biosynthesis